MGSRQIEIPGGDPTHTGSENWGPSSSSSGGGVLGVLDSDRTVYIDAGEGDDANSGDDASTAWETLYPLRDFLATLARIDSQLRVVVAPSSPVDWLALDLPPLGSGGRFVVVGEQQNTIGSFVADPGSTQLYLRRVMAFMNDDWSGYTIECISGNNVGHRRSIAAVKFGETDTIYPSVMWPADPVGDTFQVSRPASRIAWGLDDNNAPFVLRGGGGTTHSGVWFANVSIEGPCSIGRDCVANFIGVEVLDGDVGENGAIAKCIAVHDNAVLIAGASTLAVSIGQPEDDPTKWAGWGVQQPASEFWPVVSVPSARASIRGTFCGVSAEISAGRAELSDGRLRGSMTLPALAATENARVICDAVAMRSTGANVVYCNDARVSLRGNLEHEIASGLPTDTDYGPSTILRATAGGVIDVSEGNGCTGNTYGVAQDASGGGLIRWNGPPTLQSFVTGGALLVDGFKADNIELEHAPSRFGGLPGMSQIERYGVAALPRFASLPDRVVRVTDFIVQVFNGPAVELLPDPPTGYIWITNTIRVWNNSGGAISGPAGFVRVFDVDGMLWGTTSTLAIDGFTGLGAFSVGASRSAITAQIAGAGAGSVTFAGVAFLVPAPPIFIAQFINSTSFAPILGVVPTEPGLRVMPWLWGTEWSQLWAQHTTCVCSADNVAAQNLIFRITRGASAYTYAVLTSGFNANGGRIQAALLGMALKQGDVLEARLANPPNAVNTTVVRGCFELAPEL